MCVVYGVNLRSNIKEFPRNSRLTSSCARNQQYFAIYHKPVYKIITNKGKNVFIPTLRKPFFSRDGTKSQFNKFLNKDLVLQRNKKKANNSNKNVHFCTYTYFQVNFRIFSTTYFYCTFHIASLRCQVHQ